MTSRIISHFLVAACLSVAICSVSEAGPPFRSRQSYPLVYGATGRPYGPTQAHYQYQLRYGRPWYGGGHSHSRSYSTSGLSIGFYGSPGGFAYFGLNTPLFAAPNVIYSGPVYPQYGYYGLYGTVPGAPTINHVPYQVGPYQQTMIGNGFQPDPFQQQPAVNEIEPTPVIERSTTKQLQLALRQRMQGDEAFARTDYLLAGENYREALRTAPDFADARYRLAITLAARSRFEEAVEQLKIATEIEDSWPARRVTLDELYGITDPHEQMKRGEKDRVKTRIAEWANRDIRDPNRLFLLAAVMMLDGDVRAKGLLETAIRLNGAQTHLIAFLTPLTDAAATVRNERQPRANGPLVIEPGKNQNDGPDRGEIFGAERTRRVFEKEESLIPELPEELKSDLPSDDTPLTKGGAPQGPALPPLPN